MSCMYYRVEPKPVPSPRFGYKKVDRGELERIISRVTKPNVSQDGNRPRTSGQPLRPKSSKHAQRSQNLKEHEWQRMIRRLQRPTISRKMAATKNESTRERRIEYSNSLRPKSTKPISEKTVEKLCRPTTASTAKSIMNCHLCGQIMTQDYPQVFDVNYSDDKRLPKEEVEQITERVRVHTCSSRPQSRQCTRSSSRASPHPMMQDTRLPLISGLDRSKNVNEIVDRLQSSKGSRWRNVPTSTQVTVQ